MIRAGELIPLPLSAPEANGIRRAADHALKPVSLSIRLATYRRPGSSLAARRIPLASGALSGNGISSPP